VSRRIDGLAVACVALWALGAAAAPEVGVWAGIAGTALVLGLACTLAAGSFLKPLFRLGPRVLALGLSAGVVMIGATYGLYPLVASRFPSFAAGVPGLYEAFRAHRPSWAVFLLPLVIVAEEVVWRGIVYDALRRRLAPAGAVAACAVAYALAHAPARSLELTLVALVCGTFWSLLREWTRSLVPSTVSHLMWDLMVMLWWPLAGP